MTWNYRIIQTIDGNVGIYNVYYEDGIPTFRGDDSVMLISESREFLQSEFKLISQAFERHTMLETDINGNWALTNMI